MTNEHILRAFDRDLEAVQAMIMKMGGLVETALAAVVEEDAPLLGEAADLLYHLIVLLQARGLSLDDVRAVLDTRRG